MYPRRKERDWPGKFLTKEAENRPKKYFMKTWFSA
jgi:hypothetical protein